MKNSEIVRNYIGLIELVNKKEKYPVKFSFAITKNLKMLEGLNGDFETERNKYLDQYNVKDENGEPAYKSTGRIDIAKEYEKDWQDAVQELLDIDVDINVHKISLSELNGVSISAGDLLSCDFMLNE